MPRSVKVTDPPPPNYTKLSLSKGPFSRSRHGGCCLSANHWRKLRQWIGDNYGRDDLPESLRQMSPRVLLSFVRDTLWSNSPALGICPNHAMLATHRMLDIEPLTFRGRLDEAAITEAIKNLGWSVDNGIVRRAGDGSQATAND